MGILYTVLSKDGHPGLALLTLSWDKNWDSHSLVNGYPSFYPRIALVAPSPGRQMRPNERPIIAHRVVRFATNGFLKYLSPMPLNVCDSETGPLSIKLYML